MGGASAMLSPSLCALVAAACLASAAAFQMPPAVGGVRQRDMAMTRVLGLRRAPRLRALQPVGPAMMAGTATLTRDVVDGGGAPRQVMEGQIQSCRWRSRGSARFLR